MGINSSSSRISINVPKGIAVGGFLTKPDSDFKARNLCLGSCFITVQRVVIRCTFRVKPAQVKNTSLAHRARGEVRGQGSQGRLSKNGLFVETFFQDQVKHRLLALIGALAMVFLEKIG